MPSRFGLRENSDRGVLGSEGMVAVIRLAHDQVNAYASGQKKAKGLDVTIIEIRPFRNGWKVFEVPGVEPLFLNQDDAISYAEGRACFRSGEIRVLDSSGVVQRTIPFCDTDRKL